MVGFSHDTEEFYYDPPGCGRFLRVDAQPTTYSHCPEYQGPYWDQAPMWKTKDGEVMPISEMTDSHLANTIALFERSAEKQARAEELVMLSLPGPRGDMAEMAFDRDLAMMEENGAELVLERYPIYRHLCKEQERRANGRKYVVFGGEVRSKRDGDLHWIPASRVAQLYGLRPGSYRIGRYEPGFDVRPGETALGPRNDGNYTLDRRAR